MSAVDRIEAVLDAKFLMPELMIIPKRGATDAEILEEKSLLGRALCPDHSAILRRWNGIALEILMLFGCGDHTGEIGRLADLQVNHDFGLDGALLIGSDASGFAYLQTSDSTVYSFDTDGGSLTRLASSLDQFFEQLVFGADAASFGGDDWLQELREAGIVK